MAFIFFLYCSLKLLCRPHTVKYLHEMPNLGENVYKIAQNGPPSQTEVGGIETRLNLYILKTNKAEGMLRKHYFRKSKWNINGESVKGEDWFDSFKNRFTSSLTTILKIWLFIVQNTFYFRIKHLRALLIVFSLKVHVLKDKNHRFWTWFFERAPLKVTWL